MSNPSDQADATLDQDVSSEDQVVQPSARELMMEKIAHENIARVAKDFDGDLDQDQDLDRDIDPNDPDAQLQQQTRQAPIQAQPQHKVHTLKIDGQERTVTDDELIRSYQKNAAADRRLEEASNLLREANDRAHQLELQAQTQAKPNPTPAAPDVDLQAEVKDVLTKLYAGDEDIAAQALTTLLTKTRGGDQPTPAPVIDVDQIATQIQQRMEIDKAFATIQSDYPDLIADPDLEQLTAMKIDRDVANGMPRAQAMISAAEAVYKSIGKVPTGRASEQPAAKPNQRLENKQRLDLVKSASGVASTKSAGEDESASSVIADMMQRRLSPMARRQ